MDRFFKRIIWLIILSPAIYLAIVWNKMPLQVAMHFDIHGNPDKYGSKKEFLIFMIIMMLVNAAIYLLLTNVYRIDPKKYASDNRPRLQKIAFTTVCFVTVISCVIIYAGMSGSFHLNIRYMFAAMGIFWAIIGNYMHNIKPNYFAGFRLPWTLENEENWRQTHLLGGKLWFGGGLLLAITCFVIPTNLVIIIFITVTCIITIIPCIYSYRLYKQQKAKKINQ